MERRIVVLVTVLVALAGGAGAFLAYVTAARASSVVFADDFELGNLSRWSGSAGLAVQQQEVFGGSWAARATSTGSAAYAYKSLAPALLDVTYQGRFKVLSQSASGNVSLLRFRTAGVSPIASIMRKGNGRLAYWNELTGTTTQLSVAEANVWHSLHVRLVINGNSSRVDVSLDGIVLVSRTDSLGTSPIGRVYVGDPASGRAYDIAYDDQALSTEADLAPPARPTGLVATAAMSSRVDLTWSPATDDVGVTEYTVYRNGASLASVAGSVTSYSDTTALATTTYTYAVEAVDGAGNRSAQSDGATVTTPAADTQPPDAPTSLFAAPVGANRIDLSWSPATDNVAVNGYGVYRDDVRIANVPASATQYSDTGLAPGATHVYRVDAFDEAGNRSALSSPAIATTLAAPSNTSPSTISGTARTGQTLTADPGLWTGTEPISYAYQWRRCDVTGEGCVDIVPAATTAYTLVDSDVGSTIRVAVTASNSVGSSTVASAPTAVVDAEPEPPSNIVPPTITGTAQEGTAPTADPGVWTGTSPITYAYQWRRCDAEGANCVDVAGADAEAYTVGLVDIGATLRVAVTASNGLGSSTAVSSQTPVVTEASDAPANINSPTVTGAAEEEQTLTAAPGTWSGSEPIDYAYQWRRCDATGGGCTDVVPAADATYTLTAADVGWTMRVAVTASNGAGSKTVSSASTAVVTASPPPPDTTPPSSPTNVIATPLSSNRIDVAWTASTDNVGVLEYTVYREGAFLATVSANTTHFADAGVAPATGYTYTVDARDAALNRSQVSLPATATTPGAPDTTPPTAPATLNVQAVTSTRVDLTWSGSTDNVGVTGYTIYRSGTAIANVGGGTLTYADTTASSSSTYTYEVDAFDAAANHSARSPSATVTTPGLIFEDGFESGNVSRWTAAAGLVAQQLQVFTGSYAGRATSAGTAAYAYRSLSPSLGDLYYDGRFKVLSQGTTFSLVRFRTAAAGAILTIMRRTDGRLAYFNEVTGVTTLGPVATLGSWHELEVHVVVNGTSSAIEAWLDGARISAFSKADSLGTTPVGRIYIGDPASARAFDVAFDEQIITTSPDVTEPSPPAELTATAVGATHVNLEWTPGLDGGAGVKSHTIYRGGAPIATVGGKTPGYADFTAAPSTTYTYTVEAIDDAGNRSGTSAPASVTTPAASPADPKIMAVGDIACDPLSSSFNDGLGTASQCRQRYTSDIAFASNPAAILLLGDEQYTDGALWKFWDSYDMSWGRLNGIARPTPGNHEYQTPGAAGYFSYFGSAAGGATKGYYSFDIGSWHIIALNSECAQIGGCGAASPQGTWLRADLAAHPTNCTLAFWHRPRFSSGPQGSDDSFASFWDALYDAGVEVVLNGHDHHYERFAPQSPSQQATADGIREFLVGTGGEELRSLVTVANNSQVRNTSTFGVLELSLHDNSYDWRFVPELGRTFTDAGSQSCH
jgi:acid phosphatase type 7